MKYKALLRAKSGCEFEIKLGRQKDALSACHAAEEKVVRIYKGATVVDVYRSAE